MCCRIRLGIRLPPAVGLRESRPPIVRFQDPPLDRDRRRAQLRFPRGDGEPARPRHRARGPPSGFRYRQQTKIRAKLMSAPFNPLLPDVYPSRLLLQHRSVDESAQEETLRAVVDEEG